MRILLAPDAFKGTCAAADAAAELAAGLRDAVPHAEVVRHPLADGGEGTVDAALAARPGGTRVEHEVAGPAPGQRVRAAYAWFPETRLAVVEMAAASGLPLLAENQRDPTRTTTFGTGQLLLAAAQELSSSTHPSIQPSIHPPIQPSTHPTIHLSTHPPIHPSIHPPRLLLGLGGSATVDGGVGCAQALGWRFLDAEGRELPPGGGALARLDRILPPPNPVALPEIEVGCDVTNPLTGPDGAAAVFGPQKGASPDQVALLDRGLRRLAGTIRRGLGMEVETLPGGGAAGGFGAGAVAFLGGRLVPGIRRIMEITGFTARLAEADLVVTGEGCFDATSLQGKVVSGVLEAARSRGVPMVIVAGQARMAPPEGVAKLLTLTRDGEPPEAAMRETRLRLREAGRIIGAWIRNPTP